MSFSDPSTHIMEFLWPNDTIQQTITNTTQTLSVPPVEDIDLSWLPPGVNYTYEDPEECQRRRHYQVYRIIIDIFVVGFLCTAGFIGNTLAILVLRTDSMNSTVSFLLQALAVADNCYLVLCIFIQTMKALYECTMWIPGLVHVFPKIEPFLWPLASMAQTTAVWIVVLVTTDRYFAICKPLNMGRFCTPTRAKKLVTLIACLAVVYNLPRFFEYSSSPYSWPDFCRHTVLLLNLGSEMRQNYIYFIVYKTCMYFMFRMLIPLGTLTVLNMRLIMTLRGARLNRAVMTKTTCPKNDSVTLILVSVVSVFILCELPDFILRILVTVKFFVKDFQVALHYANTITNMLLTVNSSVNCLIYCLTGRRFRKVLKRLFLRTCSSPRPHFLVMDDQCTSENGGTYKRSNRNRGAVVSNTVETDTNVYTSILKETSI